MVSRIAFTVVLVCAVLVAPLAFAQQYTVTGMVHPVLNGPVLVGLLEIPFLALALFYSWRTASALRGGIFGRGMGLMAGGMLVMGIGHLLMLLDMAFGVNVLEVTFGATLSAVLWVIALVTSWALTGTGFHSIYRASRG